MRFLDADTIEGRIRLFFMIIYDWSMIIVQSFYWTTEQDPYQWICEKVPFIKSTKELQCTFMMMSVILTIYKYYHTMKHRMAIREDMKEAFCLFIIVAFFSVPYNLNYGAGEAKLFLAQPHYQLMKQVICGMILYCGLRSSYTITGGWRAEEVCKKN